MKRIAVINAGFPRNEGVHWRSIVERLCKRVKWFEPHTPERGSLSASCRFNVSDPNYTEFVSILRKSGLQLPRADDSPDHKQKFEAAMKSPVKWSERFEHVYTDAELRSFPLLRVYANRAPVESGGAETGTKYDLATGCPHCGTGAAQISPMMLELEGLPRKGHYTEANRGEMLVSSELAEALRKAGVGGVELRQACFHKTGEPLPWWQIIPKYTMPRMSRETRWLIRQGGGPNWVGCAVCERDAYCYSNASEPHDYAYDRASADPDSLPDVAATWECFGRSGTALDAERRPVPILAQPFILVKPKVFDVFRALRVRKAGFGPVRFVD